MSFGHPPDPGQPADHYPGISGRRFNPAEASRCWYDVIRKEKQSRSVHQYLDAYGKLGMPSEWAMPWNPKDDVIPGQQSLMNVYGKLGWKTNPANGAAVPPDPFLRDRRRAAKLHKEAERRERLEQERYWEGVEVPEPKAEAWCKDGKCNVAGVTWNQTPVIPPFVTAKERFEARTADGKSRQRPSSAPSLSGQSRIQAKDRPASRAIRPQSAPLTHYREASSSCGRHADPPARAAKRREKVAAVVREVVAAHFQAMLHGDKCGHVDDMRNTPKAARLRPSSAPVGRQRC